MPERYDGPLAQLWPELTPASLGALLVDRSQCLPVPPASDRRCWRGLDRTSAAGIAARAGSELGAPWTTPTASGYVRYRRDGDRETYERAVLSRQHRLSRAAVTAAATLGVAWLDDVVDGVIVLCEQTSWCWPAHDDAWERHGSVLPLITDPVLDLGAGEVAGQLAWIDHLLGDELEARTPGLRARVRHEVRARVLDPFLARRDWPWSGLDGDVHNWNPWIHGNVLVAALVLLDDPQLRATASWLALDGLDRYVDALAPDGAIDEGHAYWWNGPCRALEALDVLRHATDGVLDAVAQVPCLRETIAFPHRMHLGGEWYVNVADGRARDAAGRPWDAVHRAAAAAGCQEAMRFAAHHRDAAVTESDEMGLGRILRSLTDRGHLAASPAAPLPDTVWLPSIQLLLARTRGGSAQGLALAVKGGHNGEHHNHNDVGSLVIAVAGIPVVVDPGRATYTAQTFGPDRYQHWTVQSGWHSVPEIRGTAQAAGRQYAARDVVVTLAPERAALALDLAPAYPDTGTGVWRRTAQLHRLDGTVTVTETWALDGSGEGDPSVVHVVLAGDVRIVGPRTVRVTVPDLVDELELAFSTGELHLEVRDLDDPVLVEVWGALLTRLAVILPDTPRGELVWTARRAAPREADLDD